MKFTIYLEYPGFVVVVQTRTYPKDHVKFIRKHLSKAIRAGLEIPGHDLTDFVVGQVFDSQDGSEVWHLDS